MALTLGDTKGGLILGIESSCDETAAAVVRGGFEVLGNVVASQVALHAAYGGVVPELASREHLRNVVPVVRAAMEQAGVRFEDLDAVAVTQGPGLAGALLVGILYAKALAFGLGKPLIAVNHLEGHIHAVLMETHRRGEVALESPLLALVVSGGQVGVVMAIGPPVKRCGVCLFALDMDPVLAGPKCQGGEGQDDEELDPRPWRRRNPFLER